MQEVIIKIQNNKEFPSAPFTLLVLPLCLRAVFSKGKPTAPDPFDEAVVVCSSCTLGDYFNALFLLCENSSDPDTLLIFFFIFLFLSGKKCFVERILMKHSIAPQAPPWTSV